MNDNAEALELAAAGESHVLYGQIYTTRTAGIILPRNVFERCFLDRMTCHCGVVLMLNYLTMDDSLFAHLTEEIQSCITIV